MATVLLSSGGGFGRGSAVATSVAVAAGAATPRSASRASSVLRCSSSSIWRLRAASSPYDPSVASKPAWAISWRLSWSCRVSNEMR